MRIAEVSKMNPLDRFLYWVHERHQIYLRRKDGKPKPWTDDEVLQRYFFTNPYRENDKVTAWFRERIRDPLRDDKRVFFATVCFRWFNWPATAEVLMEVKPRSVKRNDGFGLLTQWDAGAALTALDRVRRAGGKVFTGAYIIRSPHGEGKAEGVIRWLNNVWVERHHFTEAGWTSDVTMEGVHSALTRFEGLGGFMAYEIVCDLRYTYFLENAPDKTAWGNPGPGAVRGLYRLAEGELPKSNSSSSPPRPKDWRLRMINLLAVMRRRLSKMPRFEMREAEHSLCEWDKYERARLGDGRMKRLYRGT